MKIWDWPWLNLIINEFEDIEFSDSETTISWVEYDEDVFNYIMRQFDDLKSKDTIDIYIHQEYRVQNMNTEEFETYTEEFIEETEANTMSLKYNYLSENWTIVFHKNKNL